MCGRKEPEIAGRRGVGVRDPWQREQKREGEEVPNSEWGDTGASQTKCHPFVCPRRGNVRAQYELSEPRGPGRGCLHAWGPGGQTAEETFELAGAVALAGSSLQYGWGAHGRAWLRIPGRRRQRHVFIFNRDFRIAAIAHFHFFPTGRWCSVSPRPNITPQHTRVHVQR